jgi:hypothetical protein
LNAPLQNRYDGFLSRTGSHQPSLESLKDHNQVTIESLQLTIADYRLFAFKLHQPGVKFLTALHVMKKIGSGLTIKYEYKYR